MTEPTVETPLERAIKLAGGQTALALGLTKIMGRHIRQSHVWRWLNGSGEVPPKYVIPIEKHLRGRITRHELRADIYPKGR